MKASRRGIDKFLLCYEEDGSTSRRKGSGRPTIITEDMREIVEERMQADDETTAHQLHRCLTEEHGYSSCERTALRCRTGLGWTHRGSAYCQLIRTVNKEKRLAWARQFQHEAAAGFLDVIWTDECTVQMETHRRFCCRKAGQPPKNKPR